MIDYNDKVYQSGGMSKVDRYGWGHDQNTVKFKRIDKMLLKVDTSAEGNGGYQRADVKEAVVRTIARDWSDVLCGTLKVAHRKIDGQYWIVDGQHRYLAAMMRSDIISLPCMVYESDGRADEAKYFDKGNTCVTKVTLVDRCIARRISGDDPIATKMLDVIEEYGFEWQSSHSMSKPIWRSLTSARKLLDYYGEPVFLDVVALMRDMYHNGERVDGKLALGFGYLLVNYDIPNKTSLYKWAVKMTPGELIRKINLYLARNNVSRKNYTSYGLGILNTYNNQRPPHLKLTLKEVVEE